MEGSEHTRFVFDLLDDIHEHIVAKTTGSISYLTVPEIRSIVYDNISSKNYKYTEHGRIFHFILYLNTEWENCNWIKEDTLLNLKQYIHDKPLSYNVYYIIVDITDLQTFMFETIMCTPYSFCSDLIEINLNKIKFMDGLSQLVYTEKLIVALMKSFKRTPLKSDLESSAISHFNQAMVVFGKDNLPHDIRRLDFEDEQKEITKYNGFRVKSIFSIFVELVKFKSISDTYILYPMYKLESLRSSVPLTDNEHMFKKLFDIIMYKCMNLSNFSIDTWLAWYEVEVVEEDTNLQATIGHLCYELCSLMDNGTITDEPLLKEFKPILRNIAIEKINFNDVDTDDIDTITKLVENSSKFHLNGWMKRMLQNPVAFQYDRVVQVTCNYIDCVDYNCFKTILENAIIYSRIKREDEVPEVLSNALLKGIKHLDVEDKWSILKQVLWNHADYDFHVSNNFDEQLHYVVHNEYNDDVDQQELMSILIWLIIQRPRKMMNLLIAQYITGICGLNAKECDAKKSCLYQGLVSVHVDVHPSIISEEYRDWLFGSRRFSNEKRQRIHQWVIEVIKTLHLIKASAFLSDIITPLLNPTNNHNYMFFLINLTKYVVEECQVLSVCYLDNWDEIIICMAKLMENIRWNIHNYSTVRADLCDLIILTVQPIMQNASQFNTRNLVKSKQLESLQQGLSDLHLMNRSHFSHMWLPDNITVDGMDEQFIMTVHSENYISYSNLNRSSTQKAQEEFIFSIATFLPKFTQYEINSFVTNYLSSAKPENIVDASFFLLDCVINSLMRIIVYLKTAIRKEPFNNTCERHYLSRVIFEFLSVINVTKMSCIYGEDVDVSLVVNSVAKIIMVVKQLGDKDVKCLVTLFRRLIEISQTRMSVEEISKILSLLSSIKNEMHEELIKTTMQGLMSNLLIKKSHDQD
ncbi:uncharacterized protein LOC112595343 [Melanaphis sacchari]|uniref:uncharacterized protein LOC112595343 n=1 Tax=Melanaphis sacchari TaxID=742174 RepID=UPI000DC1378B|nr:uncharacterized protein LOC112595343 [Melanaphis sacchari]